ncbi:ATP-dependent RecD-like DNA helicase [Bacillus aerolatus]|uniref:ATP-dependent RecD2 DNA helicase n=1 Tax=Bacillus aerolatus TaxID=2653354 RepID=A0A6I1FUT2_9BACI|nr:ATP-dependent RecD-like DNA helicase [Bacillus aerolatus]KAB7708683.1 ATP-dependent RecD-like DNA helicase [Bacillus aerolatus]
MEQSSMDLFADGEKYVKGRHLVTIFHNEENFYSVMRIRVTETNDTYEEKEAVVTGYFPQIHEQEVYTFYGQFKDHPKFGRQFHARHAQKEIPQTKQGIVTYLSSELFKGIGKKTAETIVETLGEGAISKILDHPSLLDDVPRLPADKAQKLYETLLEHQGLEQVMVALNQYGFGPQLSMKIYQAYQQQAIEVIQKNPYQLVEDVEGIGFGRADELGAQIGIDGEHPDRIKAGILFTVEQQSLQDGHCYLEAEPLLKEVKALLEKSGKGQINYEAIAAQLIALEEEGKVIGENDRVFLPSLYFSEKGLVSNIERMLGQNQYEDQFPESEFLLALGELEERTGVQYAPSQKEAIQKALMSPMMLLTGGPGTGKTTVIKGIVELYSELHGCSLDPKSYGKDEPFPVKLAAPTGRAAKRMAESTGLPAVTIHRLLGFSGQETLEDDESREVEGRLLIIDEMSMVDTWLAHQLFKALPDDMQVVLVGDEDQLPSVGPGQVLKDLLASGTISTVKLTDIYRQEEGSSIIEMAHEMKNGLMPSNLTKQQKDRSFLACRVQQIPEVVEQVVKNAMKKGFTAKDIQVLAPMYKGPAGIDRLNVILQEIFNANPDGSRKQIDFGDVHYRIGDKVLQLVNQPEQNIFNGDIGEVVSIFFAKENTEKQDMVIVSYEGNEVTYTRQDLNQITHAFCCSIHKSQGSEFPIVILPVVKSYYRMLRRNLLYTAITRSKQFLILCGEEEAFRIGIERNDDLTRKTALKEKLVAVLETDKQSDTQENKVQPPLSLTEDTIAAIDPMIGMENVTPYDFL